MFPYISLGRAIILLALFAQRYSQHLERLLKMSVGLDNWVSMPLKMTKGNILHCTKKTQNRTRICQWRLLKLTLNIELSVTLTVYSNILHLSWIIHFHNASELSENVKVTLSASLSLFIQYRNVYFLTYSPRGSVWIPYFSLWVTLLHW